MKPLSPIYFFVVFSLVCLVLAGCGIFDVVIITEHNEVTVGEGASSPTPVQMTPTTKTFSPTPPPTVTSPAAAAPLPITSPEVILWDETTSLPIASSAPFNDARGQQLIFHNGYVYIFGGSSAGDHSLADVYFSAIEEDGTLTGWVETTSLPGKYYDHVVVKVGNYVYLLTGAANSRDVAYAPLNSDGSVGSWIGTTPLNPGRQQFAAASHGNFIYVTGGNSGGNQSFVHFTSTKSDGSLNRWSLTSPLPDRLQAHTMLAYNGYLYVFGGINASGEWMTTVYYSAIRPDGTLAGWETTSALPIKMSSYSTFESNGYVYLVGGSSSPSYYAHILENHALDNWERVTSLPNTNINGLRTGAYNGFAYAMGGYKNGYQSGVYYGFIGVQQPPESPTPAPETQTPSASSTPVAGTLTPGPLTCQLNIHQNIHVLDGANLWSQPDVVNGSLIGTLPAGGFVYVINGPAWGLIVETGVSGWWWEISNTPNGTGLGWIWEGRVEDCSTLNVSFTPTPTETPGDENPDKFAFTSCVGNINSCEIYVMNADGSNLIQLTDNSDHDRSPAWSPDGTKIAFASNRDGDYEIYVMHADGSEQMRLTASSKSTSNPTWSPDGTKIAFISIYDGIYTMNADGSDVTKILSDNSFMFDLAWSPDGSKMAFIISTSPSRDEIFIVDADGTNLTRLLSAPIGVQNFDPAWSPDGTRIAFVLHVGDLIFKIYTVNADGSNAVYLRNGGSPSWSSDSSKIVYVSCLKDFYIAEICGIYQMDANGSNPVQLTSSVFWDFDDLAWLYKPQTQVIQLPDCTASWTQLEAGSQAEVSSESDTPNRVRSDPGMAGEIIALLYPGHEVFVIEGPICVDGLVFWRVESDAIPGGEGWTAEGDGADYWLVPKGP